MVCVYIEKFLGLRTSNEKKIVCANKFGTKYCNI
jgi:hypothetical protein